MKKYLLFPFLAATLGLLNGCGGAVATSPPPPPPTASHFSVSAPGNVPTGTSLNFTVAALDASNNTVTNYSGTVHFSSSDPHAQLPPDSMLASGMATFPATLTTGGNQMITTIDKATSSITGSSNSINVGALAGAFPVEWFGAKGDGVTDDNVRKISLAFGEGEVFLT